MTDTKILDAIQDQVDVVRMRCQTASVKIRAQMKNGVALYSFSSGPWHQSLREAVLAYQVRWKRTAFTAERQQGEDA